MPDAQFVQITTNLTNVLVDLAGGVFTLIMVYGGIRFMVARSPRAVQGAKEIMGRAAIGLVLILLVGALRALLTSIVS